MVELKCSINVTRNGQPEMLCEHQNKATLTDTSCSAGENGMFICLTKVPAEMKADYTCVIKIKHKPLFNNKMCIHASNEPDYQYTWKSSSGVCDDGMELNLFLFYFKTIFKTMFKSLEDLAGRSVFLETLLLHFLRLLGLITKVISVNVLVISFLLWLGLRIAVLYSLADQEVDLNFNTET